MTRQRAVLTLFLVLMGAGWGLTTPLTKIAVSEGYRNFGLIFWQLVIAIMVLGGMQVARGRRLRVALTHERARLFALVAVVGTVLPDAIGYTTAIFLPSGVLSVAVSMVPMFAFGVAVAWGLDRVNLGRMAGLASGMAGVLLLTLPGATMTGTITPALVLLALMGPLCYGIEGNFVARFGTAGLDPIEVLLGASVVGLVLVLPLAIVTGNWIAPPPPWAWGAPDAALVASSVIHALVYSAYVWMVGRAGPVFAAQVSYLVTGFGVGWAMLILGERYAPGFWAAFGLMMVGLFLVRPRDNSALAGVQTIGEDGVQGDSGPTS